MGFKKHGVGEVLGTEGDEITESTAKTATVSWTASDVADVVAEGKEEEEEI